MSPEKKNKKKGSTIVGDIQYTGCEHCAKKFKSEQAL